MACQVESSWRSKPCAPETPPAPPRYVSWSCSGARPSRRPHGSGFVFRLPFCPPLPLVHPLPFELNSATTGEGDDEGSREPLRPNRHPLSAQMRAQPRLSTPGQARRVGPPAPHTLERIHFAIASHLIRCTVTLQGDNEAQGSFAQGLEKHSLQGQADGCSATPLTPAVMRAAAVCNRVCGQNVFSPACIHKSLSPCPGSWHPEGCSQLPC